MLNVLTWTTWSGGIPAARALWISESTFIESAAAVKSACSIEVIQNTEIFNVREQKVQGLGEGF